MSLIGANTLEKWFSGWVSEQSVCW